VQCIFCSRKEKVIKARIMMEIEDSRFVYVLIEDFISIIAQDGRQENKGIDSMRKISSEHSTTRLTAGKSFDVSLSRRARKNFNFSSISGVMSRGNV
jgi:hypothetical protein